MSTITLPNINQAQSEGSNLDKLSSIVPLDRSTRTENVFQMLRQAILNNELKSGDRLLVTELSERLHVSRTPVREAIRMLEVKGLATRLSNGHSVIADRSMESMIEVFHVRIALESYVARLAAEVISDAQVQHLSNICAEAERMNATGDAEGLKQNGYIFHEALIEIAGNKQIARHIREILELIAVYRERIYHSNSSMENVIGNHFELIEALRARDGDAAADLMRKHLLLALDNIKDLWGVEK